MKVNGRGLYLIGWDDDQYDYDGGGDDDCGGGNGGGGDMWTQF